VQGVKADLEEAFRRTWTLTDCKGIDNLQSCREIEGLLAKSFETLEAMVQENRADGVECLSCDARPYLVPLASSLMAVGRLLQEKGYEELSAPMRRAEQEVELWKRKGCCSGGNARPERPRDREADARAVLTEKCGATFVDNRRNLRQVVRMPDDRQGCYQSRACRSATSYNGELMRGGFWTYDGEYWYVWAERRIPRGEWITCDE
jgi:hypothetical protein